ncbi:MAG: ABC transporter ATP-binding protein, partial [Myxococcota bacterium]
MIRDLHKLLGPRHASALRIYLAWLIAFSVLQALAMVLLVPALQALLTANVDRALLWLLVLSALVAVTCAARYQQTMHGFALALVVLTTLH